MDNSLPTQTAAIAKKETPLQIMLNNINGSNDTISNLSERFETLYARLTGSSSNKDQGDDNVEAPIQGQYDQVFYAQKEQSRLLNDLRAIVEAMEEFL